MTKMNNMEGQLSLFPEEKNPPEKKKKENIDPSKTFDERMKRFLHYMETKGMNEQWIEMAFGEIRIVIEALADYYDFMSEQVREMEIGYPKAVWGDRLERIKQIQAKLEESTGYNRDRQLETCNKRRGSRDDGVWEDALVLATQKRKNNAKRTPEKAPIEQGEDMTE